jgi:hypothetical protein
MPSAPAKTLGTNSGSVIGERSTNQTPSAQQCYDKLLAVLGSSLSTPEFDSLAGEGAAWTEDRVVEEACRP